MTKFAVGYTIRLVGVCYVEAPSVSLAYSSMYESFKENNSLIVHANIPYGFEILHSAVCNDEFPEPRNVRVTTWDEVNTSKLMGHLNSSELKPKKIANPSLFDFGADADFK